MIAQANTATETTFGRIGLDDAITAIKAENRRAGVTMSYPDEVATAHQLANALRLDHATGRTIVTDVDGNEKTGISAGEFIAQLQASTTPPLYHKASGAPALDGLNPTQRAIAKNKAKALADQPLRTSGK